jgi:hypothetical protein
MHGFGHGTFLTVQQPAHTMVVLIATCFHSGFFDPEDGGIMFLQNVS